MTDQGVETGDSWEHWEDNLETECIAEEKLEEPGEWKFGKIFDVFEGHTTPFSWAAKLREALVDLTPKSSAIPRLNIFTSAIRKVQPTYNVDSFLGPRQGPKILREILVETDFHWCPCLLTSVWETRAALALAQFDQDAFWGFAKITAYKIETIKAVPGRRGAARGWMCRNSISRINIFFDLSTGLQNFLAESNDSPVFIALAAPSRTPSSGTSSLEWVLKSVINARKHNNHNFLAEIKNLLGTKQEKFTRHLIRALFTTTKYSSFRKINLNQSNSQVKISLLKDRSRGNFLRKIDRYYPLPISVIRKVLSNNKKESSALWSPDISERKKKREFSKGGVRLGFWNSQGFRASAIRRATVIDTIATLNLSLAYVQEGNIRKIDLPTVENDFSSRGYAVSPVIIEGKSKEQRTGVILVFKKGTPVRPVDDLSSLEFFLVAEMELEVTILTAGTYISPSSSRSKDDHVRFLNELKIISDYAHDYDLPLVLGGDFNCNHPKFAYVDSANSAGMRLVKIMDEISLDLQNAFMATRQDSNNTLDLIFANRHAKILDIETGDVIFPEGKPGNPYISDHFPVVVCVGGRNIVHRKVSPLWAPPRSDKAKENFTKDLDNGMAPFLHDLNKIWKEAGGPDLSVKGARLPNPLNLLHVNLDELWAKMRKKYIRTIKKYLRRPGSPKMEVTLPEDLQQTLAGLTSSAKAGDIEAGIALNTLRKKLNAERRTKETAAWIRKIENSNRDNDPSSKKLFELLGDAPNAISAILDERNRFVSHPEDIAECFGRFFSGNRIYRGEVKADYSDIHWSAEGPAANAQKFKESIEWQNARKTSLRLPYNSILCTQDLEKAIADAPKGKHGGDEIWDWSLRNGGRTFMKCRLVLYNITFALGDIARKWRDAVLCPIYKGQQKLKADRGSYRPIALMGHVAKEYQRLLQVRFEWTIEKNLILPEWTWGFRKKRSIEQALLIMTETIRRKLRGGKKVALLAFDISKAYDKIDPKSIVRKLISAGLRGPLMEALSAFFKPGRIKCKVAGVLGKTWFSKEEGILQGGINQPLAFAVGFDIFEEKDEGHKTLVADDGSAVVWASTQELLKAKILTVIHTVNPRLEPLNLGWNFDKTFVMQFSRQDPPPPTLNISFQKKGKIIHIKDRTLDPEPPILLGLRLDYKLSGSKHLEYLEARLDSRLRMIKRLANKFTGLSQEDLLFIYKQWARSTFLYPSKVFIHQEDNLKAIDRIQKKWLVTILRATKNSAKTGLEVLGEIRAASSYLKAHMIKFVSKALELPLNHTFRIFLTNELNSGILWEGSFAYSLQKWISTWKFDGCWDSLLKRKPSKPDPAFKMLGANLPPWLREEIEVLWDASEFSDIPKSNKRERKRTFMSLILEKTQAMEKPILVIFSDGSYDPTSGHTGAGFLVTRINSHADRSKLGGGPHVAEFKASIAVSSLGSAILGEIVGVMSAADFLTYMPQESPTPKNLIFLLDCESVLLKLVSGECLEDYYNSSILTHRFLDFLKKKYRIYMAWCPGHSDILLNGVVDNLAKIAINPKKAKTLHNENFNYDPQKPFPSQQLILDRQTEIHGISIPSTNYALKLESWRDTIAGWEKDGHAAFCKRIRAQAFFHGVKVLPFADSIHHKIPLVSACINRVILDKLGLKGQVYSLDSTICDFCGNDIETLKHFFAECPYWDELRRTFISDCAELYTILGFKGGWNELTFNPKGPFAESHLDSLFGYPGPMDKEAAVWFEAQRQILVTKYVVMSERFPSQFPKEKAMEVIGKCIYAPPKFKTANSFGEIFPQPE